MEISALRAIAPIDHFHGTSFSFTTEVNMREGTTVEHGAAEAGCGAGESAQQNERVESLCRFASALRALRCCQDSERHMRRLAMICVNAQLQHDLLSRDDAPSKLSRAECERALKARLASWDIQWVSKE
jgi:hypothetical protein